MPRATAASGGQGSRGANAISGRTTSPGRSAGATGRAQPDPSSTTRGRGVNAGDRRRPFRVPHTPAVPGAVEGPRPGDRAAAVDEAVARVIRAVVERAGDHTVRPLRRGGILVGTQRGAEVVGDRTGVNAIPPQHRARAEGAAGHGGVLLAEDEGVGQAVRDLV